MTNEELKSNGNVKLAYTQFKLSSKGIFDLEAGVGPVEEEEDEPEDGFNYQNNDKNDTQVGSPEKHEFGKMITSKGLGNSKTFFDITQIPQNQQWVRCAGKQ